MKSVISSYHLTFLLLFPLFLQESELESLRADAFVVMFSIADQESYRSALDMVRHLRVDLGLDRAILLVGNKVDLARQRKVAVRGEHAVWGFRRRLSG